MLKLFTILILFSGLLGAQALPVENPRPQKWPDRIWRNLVMLGDDAAYSLSQVLFDAIDKFDVKLYGNDHTELKLKVEREVFDNQDVLNSFSVVDYTSLELKTEALNYQFPLSANNINLGISLSTGLGLDFINIRQVSASKYAQLPTVQEEYSEFISDDGNVRDIDTQNGGYFDPSWRPRTNRLWNFATIPFRLPTSLEKYNKLENGELVSYGVSGFVEFAAGIGFNLIDSNIDVDLIDEEDEPRLGIEVSYKTYLKGIFRITVLKENNRFARVKISRARERGSLFQINGGGEGFELFEGFLLFEGKKLETRLLETKFSLLPFEFKAQRKYIKAFDLGFRYDLSDPKAQDAFENATRGSFALSQELMDRVDSQGNKIVERLFERNAHTHIRSHQNELNLRFYRRRAARTRESLRAIITLPSGEHHVIKEVRSHNKDWKLIWGRFEKLNYNFITTMDKTSFMSGKADAFQLVAEARIEDSHTNGYEMQEYTNNVKKALGKPDILPDLPSFLPLYQLHHHMDEASSIDVLNNMGVANYRKSTFYYGFNIDQEKLIKFINTPISKMWSLLEKAFGIPQGVWSSRRARALYGFRHILPTIANVPLYLANVHLRKGSNLISARKMRKNWIKAQRAFNQVEPNYNYVLERLAEIFKHKHFGHEQLRLILLSLADEELDYFLVATNDAFGRIQQRGRVTMNPEYLLNLTDQNIGFERLAGGYTSNPDILIKDLTHEVDFEKEQVKISFTLDHDPKIVYFKLFLSNRLKPFYILSELAYDNKTRFKKGRNTIILDKKSLNELSHKLGRELRGGSFHSLTISTSMDGFSWSKVANTRFLFSSDLDIE